MIFGPDLVDAILEGRKTQTRRRINESGVCQYVPGRSYAVQPGRGKRAVARIRIVAVERVPTGSISFDDARAEGFESVAEFFDRWRSIYGDRDLGSCWKITFEREET